MNPVLVVGTHNRNKREELVAILADVGWEIRDLSGWPDAPDVVEDGTTFFENARKKAVELSHHLGHWTLGEDSGLVVPALGGRPGVYSARWSGHDHDDQANNAKLLSEMADLPDDRRAAYYVCTIVVADPGGHVHGQVEGRCHGVITRDYQGSGGFSYDPLFFVPEYGKTFGELPSEVKNKIAHRADAITQLRPILRSLSAGAV